MEALIERRTHRRRDLRQADRPKIMACGWCKGFVHEARVSDMIRYIHDERPITDHEVLPYRVS